MRNLALENMGDIQRKLLAVFERHGADGRAITMDSLAATVGMQKHPLDLRRALQALATQRVIEVAGHDPLPGQPLAFRLAKSSPHKSADLIRDLPRRRSPPLSPTGHTDRSIRPAKSSTPVTANEKSSH